MPCIKCVALSNEERILNIYLENGDLISLDTNKHNIAVRLEDFGI
jgi:hypothetical protein